MDRNNDHSDQYSQTYTSSVIKCIELNNRAYFAAKQGHFQEAIDLYKVALDLKARTNGAISLSVCISLSGLADAYLQLQDYDNASKEANRMLKIAGKLNNSEQRRIANEILHELSKVNH